MHYQIGQLVVRQNYDNTFSVGHIVFANEQLIRVKLINGGGFETFCRKYGAGWEGL